MKRSITLLLALCMMMGLAIPAFSVETEHVERYFAVGETYSSPFYDEEIIYSWQPTALLYGEQPEYRTFEEAVLEIREALKAREESFVIYCKTDEIKLTLKQEDGELVRDNDGNVIIESGKEGLERLFNEALNHTGDPREGDYLRYHILHRGYGLGLIVSGTNVMNEYAIRYDIVYSDDEDKEKDTTTAVENIIPSLGLDTKTDYQKVKAIYDYLCTNVEYSSNEEIADNDKHEHSAYAALVGGEAVCQGYATAFYRLALEAGVDARCISGTGNGGPHAWNIVKLGNKYYNLDSTWDAGRTEYGYFLLGSKFDSDHLRNGSAGVNLEGHLDYMSTEFTSAYPMSTTDYDPGSQNMTSLSISSAEGAPDGYSKVLVNIAEESGAAMIQFTMDFDPEKLQVFSVAPGELMTDSENYPTMNFDNTSGKIYFAWEALEGLENGGTIMEIVFKLDEELEVGSDADVGFNNGSEEDEETILGKFEGTDPSGKAEYTDIPKETEDGKVTVIDKTLYDISGSVIMPDEKDNVKYLLYPFETSDNDIKSDAKLDYPRMNVLAVAITEEPKAVAETEKYSQEFLIDAVEAGKYKLAVYKNGCGIHIETIELNADVTVKEIELKKGGKISGTVTMWNNSDDVVYLIYPADTPDAEIKTDAKLAEPLKDDNVAVEKGTLEAVDGKYSQSFEFGALEEGSYKLVMYKPGKYVLKIIEVEVTDADIDLGEQGLWLKGDADTNGEVDFGDLQRLFLHLNETLPLLNDGLIIADTDENSSVDFGDLQRLFLHLNETILFEN